MEIFELIPKNGRKSFGHKAIVQVDTNGDRTLFSYCTPIIKQCADGRVIRLWDKWSSTTGAHIMTFCGLNKAEFEALPIETIR